MKGRQTSVWETCLDLYFGLRMNYWRPKDVGENLRTSCNLGKRWWCGQGWWCANVDGFERFTGRQWAVLKECHAFSHSSLVYAPCLHLVNSYASSRQQVKASVSWEPSRTSQTQSDPIVPSCVSTSHCTVRMCDYWTSSDSAGVLSGMLTLTLPAICSDQCITHSRWLTEWMNSLNIGVGWGMIVPFI